MKHIVLQGNITIFWSKKCCFLDINIQSLNTVSNEDNY
jgi:hypothetical protein